jgi:hypothetical protein
MFGSTLLDIAIGLIFVYLLLSLICSALNEIIEAWLKKRATDLERGIAELLLDPEGKKGMLQDLYKHPLISGLFKGDYKSSLEKKLWDNITNRTNLPSYIPPRNFALALMDIVLPGQANTPSGAAGATGGSTVPGSGATGATVSPAASPAGGTTPNPLQPFRNAIGGIQNNDDLKRALLALVDAAGNDVSNARKNIEAWYNSSMERLTGWYKRRSQAIILVLGLGVVIAVNADTIAISTSLSRDKAARDAVVAEAQEFAKQQSAEGKPMERVGQYTDKIRNLGLPLGWNEGNPLSIPDECISWFLKILGWLITTVAISLGAPFWFDLLNKFMAVRSSVKPKEEKPAAESEG